MESRRLGADGPDVPVICPGAWPLGGGMGAVPDVQAIATVHAALDAGVTFIDTAEGYRTSERVLKGFRREATVSDLCRREGITLANYYYASLPG